ncbi:ribosome maturation factor RimP [Brevinema andersonii]|uniref:Ribosome maturation factor RimP n=1 Tax=Brevinema andersonii TaxID=34097 RepID=A0A1I1DS73_BREAD|nr:hypothetical protein [Brevinema andersonii]SFB77246.1 ribosome maturation factor RimP [Brevinema andersonii]
MKQNELFDFIKNIIIELDYIPLEINLTHIKNKTILKIVIHHLKHPVSLDDCTEIANIVSRQLDIENPFDKAYDLVVESPGLQREIKSLEEYQYFIGRELCIFPKTTDKFPTKDRFFIAFLENICDNTLTVKNNQHIFNISCDEIQKAHLFFDFSKALKNNKKKNHKIHGG